jgi:hypothetical protein
MNSEIEYKEKYLKYKSKYLKLKEEEQEGGLVTSGYYYVFYNSLDDSSKKFIEDIDTSKIKNNDYFYNKFPDGRYNSFNKITTALPQGYYVKNGDTKIRPFILVNSFVNRVFGMLFTNEQILNIFIKEYRKKADKEKDQTKKNKLLEYANKDKIIEIFKKIDIKCDNKCFDIKYNLLSSNNYSKDDITKSDKIAGEIIKKMEKMKIYVDSYLIFSTSTVGNYFIHNQKINKLPIPSHNNFTYDLSSISKDDPQKGGYSALTLYALQSEGVLILPIFILLDVFLNILNLFVFMTLPSNKYEK